MKIGRRSRSKSKYCPLLQSKSRRTFLNFGLLSSNCIASAVWHWSSNHLQKHRDHGEKDSANDGGSRTAFGIPVETLCSLLVTLLPFGPRTNCVIDGEQAEPTAEEGCKDCPTWRNIWWSRTLGDDMYSRVLNDLKENHKRLLTIKFGGLNNSVQKFGASMVKIKDFALAYKNLGVFRHRLSVGPWSKIFWRAQYI